MTVLSSATGPASVAELEMRLYTLRRVMRRLTNLGDIEQVEARIAGVLRQLNALHPGGVNGQ